MYSRLRYIIFLLFLCSVTLFSGEITTEQVEEKLQPNIAAPARIRIPAEWEEVQAIVVSWPFTKAAPQYDHVEVQQYYERLASVWVDLATAVQEECEIWIRIYEAEDSLKVKTFFNNSEAKLYRYKFIVYPGDNFWVRDYGAIGYYYGESDSIGMIDARYHTPSTNYFTDAFPTEIARTKNAQLVKTKLVYDGGNFKTDGFGNGFFTSQVFSQNAGFVLCAHRRVGVECVLYFASNRLPCDCNPARKQSSRY